MSGQFLPGDAAPDPPRTKRRGEVFVELKIPSRPTPSRPRAKVARRFSVGRRSRLVTTPTLKNESEKSLSRPKNPQAMATYVPEVARLTCDAGSNSRLRITERGMTGDEHNRGQGLNPTGSRRIFASHIQDPRGCHVSGIPSREASSPRNLANGSDIHRDCPRVLFEMCP